MVAAVVRTRTMLRLLVDIRPAIASQPDQVGIAPIPSPRTSPVFRVSQHLCQDV